MHASRPIHLRVEDRTHNPLDPSRPYPPLLATNPTPRLSWVVPLQRTGQKQAGYQLWAEIHCTPERKVWEPPLVNSEENYGIIWSGPELKPGSLVKWKVRTADENGDLSEWSDSADFVVPPLDISDWTGTWISVPPTSAAVFHFSVDYVPTRILLHFTAQGFVRGYLDGVCINFSSRDPTDAARTRATSRTYDVTSALDKSRRTHVLAFVAALGHHQKVLQEARLLADLVMYTDEGRKTIGTSSAWTLANTPLVIEDPFYTEVHDDTCGDAWLTEAQAGPSAKEPGAVGPDEYPIPLHVVPDAGPPLHVVAERQPTLLSDSPACQVYDVGENVAARTRIEVKGTRRGQVIEVVHGEMLENGRVDTSNLHFDWDRDKERQAVRWTCAREETTIEPWFSIHGFRYFEVRGLESATVINVTIRVIHSDVPVTATFSSSDPLLDQLLLAGQRTQLNNLHGHPEDCPTREQSGWTGDASVSAKAALCHLDIAGVYQNWLRDVGEDQREDGGILGVSPRVVPDSGIQPPDPVWGSAVTEIPLEMYRTTGDTSVLVPFLPMMRKWCNWQVATLDDGVVRHSDISFGADWLALEQTPPVMLQTAAVIRSLFALSDMEKALGNEREATSRRKQARDLIESARKLLWDSEDGVWANGTQAAYGVALSSDMVKPEERTLVEQRLFETVLAANGKITSGYSGTQSVVNALADIDNGRLLLDMIHDSSSPGIGTMLAQPPGTLWETWYRKEPPLGISSLDHIGLAAPFVAWLWTHVAGIRALTPGYRTFTVDLSASGFLDYLDVEMLTVRGPIRLQWQRSTKVIDVEVGVPVGSTLRLIPTKSALMFEINGQTLPISQHPHLELAPGVHNVKVHEGKADEPGLAHVSLPPSRSHLWLSGSKDVDGWIAASEHTTLKLVGDRWTCAPVFHEPEDGATLHVTHRQLAANEIRWITVPFNNSLDLSAARFAFANVDICNHSLKGRKIRPTIRIVSQDGSVREDTVRLLPACWNRVAVDIEGWAGRNAVRQLSIGIEWTKEHDPAQGPDVAPPDGPIDFSMVVSRVGYSTAKRTW